MVFCSGLHPLHRDISLIRGNSYTYLLAQGQIFRMNLEMLWFSKVVAVGFSSRSMTSLLLGSRQGFQYQAWCSSCWAGLTSCSVEICFEHICQILDISHMYSCLGLLFCSVCVSVYFYASTILFLLLWLCDVSWGLEWFCCHWSIVVLYL